MGIHTHTKAKLSVQYSSAAMHSFLLAHTFFNKATARDINPKQKQSRKNPREICSHPRRGKLKLRRPGVTDCLGHLKQSDHIVLVRVGHLDCRPVSPVDWPNHVGLSATEPHLQSKQCRSYCLLAFVIAVSVALWITLEVSVFCL